MDDEDLSLDDNSPDKNSPEKQSIDEKSVESKSLDEKFFLKSQSQISQALSTESNPLDILMPKPEI